MDQMSDHLKIVLKKFNYKFCASVSSCTSGLELVLKTLNLKKMMK